ncbi:TonB-dependent siderophore receptor [Zoogloea sp.]|uniref:TonB-dependent siderophore receptor n=1 Tax=Zoogloea sp. TaxID=49181 RepID=UPI00141642B9|nr:MAG: TonB-dependent siderophore receptor [Zoogloea sp.]
MFLRLPLAPRLARRPLVCAIAALLSSNTHAAEAADTGGPTLAPVRVVDRAVEEPPSERSGRYTVRRSRAATGLNLSLKDTPQTVSVVSRAEMNDFHLDSANEVLGATSGVTVERVETNRTYYTARGFDITTFQTDGIGMPFAYGNAYGDIDTAIYDRVEAVYGANGLMSSTGYPAATINFVRKRPTADLQAAARVKFGSWGSRRVDGDVSAPLVASGAVRGRLVVAHENADSYLDRYGQRKNLFYAVLEADLGQATVLTVGHHEQYNKATSPLWGALPMFYTDGSRTNYDRSTSTAANWAYWNSTFKSSFAELSHDFSADWQGKLVLTRNTSSNDSALFYVYGTPDRATGLGALSYPSRYASDNPQTLADLQLSGRFRLGGRSHDVVMGANWARATLDDLSLYGRGIGTALPPLESWNGDYPMPLFDAAVAGSAFTYRQRSAYLAGRFDPMDGVKLIAGARATRSDIEGESYGVPRTSRASDVSPYLGAVVDLTPEVAAYASHTDIFTPQYQLDQDGKALDPVTGRSSEAGLKGAFLDKRLNASVALFRTAQANLAELGGAVGGRSWYKGIDARSKGFQLDVAGELSPRWQARLGYTQLSIHGDDGEDVRTYAPRRLLRASTTYALPFIEGLKLGVALSRQSDVYAVSGDNVLRQSAYTLVDLMARYEIDKHLSVGANLRNLTDEKYLASLYWGSYGQGYYGAPRNASVSLNWTY